METCLRLRLCDFFYADEMDDRQYVCDLRELPVGRGVRVVVLGQAAAVTSACLWTGLEQTCHVPGTGHGPAASII